ncbi:hypothetical protein MTATph1_CDS0061 [Moorella phage MTATph1]
MYYCYNNGRCYSRPLLSFYKNFSPDHLTILSS